MLTIRDYCVPKTLEEGYDLLQKKGSAILGGGCWLNMGRTALNRAIDLSGLLSHEITEEADCFRIGAMTTLRTFETHPGLNAFFHGLPARAVRPIVGVQFRNCATVGGSVYGRFGFSDVLTLLLVLDCQVELFHGGLIPLADFAARDFSEKDILCSVVIRKTADRAAIQSVRRNSNDFPVLVCALSEWNGVFRAAVGARPNRAKLVTGVPFEGDGKAAARQVTEQLTFGSNMRGSAEYRAHLSRVLLERCWMEWKGEEPEWK